MKWYRKAAEQGDAHAQRNLGMMYLMHGDFEHGWSEYEWRFKVKDLHQRMIDRREFRQPIWDGSAFPGKSLLVRSEQGAGDMIQFARYLPMVKERGGTVLLESRPYLQRLLRQIKGVDSIVDWTNVSDGRADFVISIMSLPSIFTHTEQEIPATVPYLEPEKALVESVGSRIDSPRIRVGVCWQGNKDFPNDRYRSCGLERLKPILNVPGIQFYSLQKGYGSEQLGQVSGGDEIVDLSCVDDGSDAFVGTAAAMNHLDLIITVDTSIAHLAGALGRPTWVLLHKPAEWRWLMDRTTSPWYPTMRLFRQKDTGGWDEPIGLLCEDLSAFVKAKELRAAGNGSAS